MTDKSDKIEKKVVKEGAIKRWYRETVGELRKVSWPTTREAVRLTWIVLLVMAAMAILLGALDWGFSELITLILS